MWGVSQDKCFDAHQDLISININQQFNLYRCASIYFKIEIFRLNVILINNRHWVNKGGLAQLVEHWFRRVSNQQVWFIIRTR